MEGIEPSKSAWKTEVLPLNYICIRARFKGTWEPHYLFFFMILFILLCHFTNHVSSDTPRISDCTTTKNIYSTGAPYNKACSMLLSKERVFTEEPARNLWRKYLESNQELTGSLARCSTFWTIFPNWGIVCVLALDLSFLPLSYMSKPHHGAPSRSRTYNLRFTIPLLCHWAIEANWRFMRESNPLHSIDSRV